MGNFQHLADQVLDKQHNKETKKHEDTKSFLFPLLGEETGNFCKYTGNLIGNSKLEILAKPHMYLGVSMETKQETIRKPSYFIQETFIDEKVSKVSSQKPTNTYITQRMAELRLSKEDVRGETDLTLALDEDELNDIRNNKQLFDIWVEHVHRHKQLRALELAKQKQAEEYTLGDTLGSLTFEHKLKFVEHVLTTFKKFFLGDRYAGQKSDHLFLEMWWLRNEDLTLGQIFNASAELIRLAKVARGAGENVEFKRLRRVSENPEYFRGFCLNESQNASNAVKG